MEVHNKIPYTVKWYVGVIFSAPFELSSRLLKITLQKRNRRGRNLLAFRWQPYRRPTNDVGTSRSYRYSTVRNRWNFYLFWQAKYSKNYDNLKSSSNFRASNFVKLLLLVEKVFGACGLFDRIWIILSISFLRWLSFFGLLFFFNNEPNWLNIFRKSFLRTWA